MTQIPGTGRNDRCPCGSGKKYKHCCLLSARQGAFYGARVRSCGTLTECEEHRDDLGDLEQAAGR